MATWMAKKALYMDQRKLSSTVFERNTKVLSSRIHHKREESRVKT
jgi:hypothetical protein